jgi:hypothetical protein
MRPVVLTKTLAAASVNNIAQSQSLAGAGNFALNGAAVVGGVAVLDTQRRVLVTSAGNDSGITFTVFGTNQAGTAIQETVTGASAGAVPTNQDFLTVTKVSASGATASTVQIGTNTTGSTPWVLVDPQVTPTMVGAAVIVGASPPSFVVEYTYDDFLNLAAGTFANPLSGNTPTPLKNLNASGDGVFNFTFRGLRLTITAGTTAATMTAIQAGIRQ